MRAGLVFTAIVLASTVAPATAATFLTGVAAGDVGQTRATLWARASAPGPLSFEVSRAPDFAGIIGSFASTIGDTTVPAHQLVTGLSSGTRYYYRATDSAGNRSQGTFVTPNDLGTAGGLRFGVSGDSRGELAPFPSIRNAPSRNLDFFVHLGDSIYADEPSPLVPLAQATTVSEFRAKHAEQLMPRDGLNTWVELRQSTALYATIDDHEVTDDFAGGAPISSDPRFAGTGAPADRINTSTLYQNGLQAFQDYMPIEQRTYSGTGDARVEGRPDLYRVQRFGDDAALIMLDGRSFRDAPIDDSNPAVTLSAAFDPDRTLLGRPQIERLKADLLAAQADGVTWKFVATPAPIENLGPIESADRYEGFGAERAEILGFIRDKHIRNVVFISADVHGSAINNLTYQTVNGTASELSFLGPQIPVDSFEVTTGPVAFRRLLGAQIVRIAAANGIIGSADVAFYESLPIAPDIDDLLNDQDDFVQSLINQQLAVFPTPLNNYSPLGLGDSGLRFDLLAGDWLIAHTFGWTEFEIDPLTGKLLITTWGIPYTDAIGALGNPDALAALQPSPVGQLSVAAVIPEPATWATMIVGCYLIGGTLRWRNRRRACA